MQPSSTASPRDPEVGVWFGRIGLVHLLQSRIAEAILWLEKARNADPALAYVRSRLASAYALNGEIERAAVELAEARELSVDKRYSSIAQFLKAGETGSGYWGAPKIRALYEATYFAGLRKAGMPEARPTLSVSRDASHQCCGTRGVQGSSTDTVG